MWLFASGFFPSACFKVHTCYSIDQYLIPFDGLIILHMAITQFVYLFIHPFMDIWLVSTFWLLRIVLL